MKFLLLPLGITVCICAYSQSPAVSRSVQPSQSAIQAQQTLNDTIGKSLDAVIVTGQYSPQSLRNSVYKLRVIDQQRIRQRGATDIIGVLNNEAGIRFTNDFALGESDISIMGMSGQNVKVLLDGVPLVDRGSFKQSLSQVDINTVERIEIVEGPMSVVYGTDALAGVINIITKKGRVGEHTLSISARVQEETTGNRYKAFDYDGLHHENFGIAWSQKKWNANASFSRNNFGGFSDTAIYPTKEWKPKDQWLASAGIGYRIQRFNAWYRLNYLNEEIFSAGPVNLNNYKALDQYYLTNRYTHQVQADWQLDSSVKITTAISYQDYKRETKTFDINYRDDTKVATNPGLAGNEGHWDINTFKNFFVRSTMQWIISSKVSLQPGVEVKTDRTTGQRIKGNPSITDYAVFASLEYRPLQWITVRPGLRFIKNSVYKAPPVIPSVNAKLALNKEFDLRLSYARGFRAPILRELYFLFRDGNHDIIGNESLEAETSNSYQASLQWQPAEITAATFNLSLSGFYNEFSNRIELAAVPNSTTFSYINVEKYKTTGGTVESNLAYQQLSVTIGASYIGRYNLLSADISADDSNIPEFSWSPEISTNIIYQFPKLGAQAGLFYKYTGKLPSYQTRINNTTSKEEVYLASVNGYHWADFTLSKKLFKYLTLQGGIKNIFDVTRLNSTQQSTGGVHTGSGAILTAYGRSYFLGINFQWSK